MDDFVADPRHLTFMSSGTLPLSLTQLLTVPQLNASSVCLWHSRDFLPSRVYNLDVCLAIQMLREQERVRQILAILLHSKGKTRELNRAGQSSYGWSSLTHCLGQDCGHHTGGRCCAFMCYWLLTDHQSYSDIEYLLESLSAYGYFSAASANNKTSLGELPAWTWQRSMQN